MTHPALTAAIAGIDTHDHRARWERTERSSVWWELHGTDPTEIDDHYRSHLESAAESAATQFGRWLTGVPARYRDAALADLNDDQHPDDLRRWYADAEALTLFVAGPPGRGKTHAAYALANQDAAHAAVTGLLLPEAWTAPGLLDALRPTNGDAETTWQKVKEAPMLVLDDLANVRSTEWSVERLWILADARTAENRRTIITTNAAWADLEECWGIPTMDRWRDRSAIVKFAGDNHRRPAW